MQRSFSLGTFFGIELRTDWSWPVAVGLALWLLATQYFPGSDPGWPSGTGLSLAFATTVFLFVSIAAHELGHALVATRLGLPVSCIRLSAFGGLTEVSREPERPRDELLIAAAGPLVSFLFALGFETLAWAEPGAVGSPAATFGRWLGAVNLSLALFNLLPGLQLDGGRMLRAIAWGRLHSFRTATLAAGLASRLLAFGLVFGGALLFLRGIRNVGLWVAFGGWFLDETTRLGLASFMPHTALAGHTAREVMMVDCPRVTPAQTIQELVDDLLPAGDRRCFPVVGGAGVTGIVTLRAIRQVPCVKWPTTTVGRVMIPLRELPAVTPGTELAEVLERMAQAGVDPIPVVDNGILIGMISSHNLSARLPAFTPMVVE